MSIQSWRLALHAAVCVASVASAGCKHEAVVRGTLQQAGKGVPHAGVVMGCPDGTRYVTTTGATGEFRFEDVGPGVDDTCTVEIDQTGTWVPPQAVGPRCGQHDAGGKCTEAIFAFEVR